MKKTGFTLIETLVAVTILIIGVIGPLSLAARGISDGLFAQNQLTANLLAQEAMETIVNARNSNIINDPSTPFLNIWPTGNSDAQIDTIGVDAVNGTVDIDCQYGVGNKGCFLAYDLTKGYYEKNTQGGPFFRQITLYQPDPTTSELKVVVTMTWLNKTVAKKFTISEYLYGK